MVAPMCPGRVAVFGSGVWAISAWLWASPAIAQDGSGTPSDRGETPDPATEKAKSHFTAGTAHIKKQRWAEALAEFERANAIVPHAITAYNVGYCLRALGHYTRAQSLFKGVVGSTELPADLAERVRGYLGEIDSLLARYQVTLAPADAKLAVDGRPLSLEGEHDGQPIYVAGVAPPGAAEGVRAHRSAGAAGANTQFTLIIEPGAHLVQLVRRGFANGTVKLDVPSGHRGEIALSADRLPARLEVTSDPATAAVRVDGSDVGVTPLSLVRPGGSYRFEVVKRGYQNYVTTVRVEPGQDASIKAQLQPEKVPITSRWWFWTAAATVVAGGVVATYFLARPKPEPAPYSGGGLGWIVAIP
jgi:hypothetical protein